GALGLLEPHPEHVAVAVDGDAQGEVAGPPLDSAALADLEHERVEEDDWIDVVEGSLLPLAHVLDHGVGYPADQVAADLDAVQLGQVRLDISRREPARVEGEDLLVEALEASLALAHQLRLEAAPAVAPRLGLDRSLLRRQ